MGETTGIPWTDHTFNPWHGCQEVSPACGLPLPGDEDKPHGVCYAKTRDANPYWNPQLRILGQTHWGKDAPRRFFAEEHWRGPERWNKAAFKAGVRKRVFCGSMCDIMEDRRDLDAWRARVFHLVLITPWLDWLFLTKRPQNYKRMLPKAWLTNPRPNVWLGTTLETPAYTWRPDELRQLDCAVRFLSMEPQLLPFTDAELHTALHRIDWVIFGGESGKGARNFNLSWVDQGMKIALTEGAIPFVKQMGAKCIDGDLNTGAPGFGTPSGVLQVQRIFKDKAGADPAEWPARYRVQEFPTPRRFAE